MAEEKDNFARSRGEINLVGFLVIVWYNKRKYHFIWKQTLARNMMATGMNVDVAKMVL